MNVFQYVLEESRLKFVLEEDLVVRMCFVPVTIQLYGEVQFVIFLNVIIFLLLMNRMFVLEEANVLGQINVRATTIGEI